MKKIFTFTNILGAVAVLGLISACATTATNSAATAMSQKEMMLAQAGFKNRTVTTAKQQQQVSQLTPGRVSMVKYQGKIYYVYPTSTRDKIYVGNKSMYQSYKRRMTQASQQAPAAQQSQQPTKAQQAQQALAPIAIQMDPDPRGVSVQEFDGFGPMTAITDGE